MSSALSQIPVALAETALASKDTAEAERAAADKKKAGKDFEAMFLRQTLESILPDAKNSVFGGGTAGGMWRSMLADRVSGVMAERGVLGLSEILTATKDGK